MLVVVEVSFGSGPAAVVDAPAVRRRLVNLETFMNVFDEVVLLIFEVHMPFVPEAGGG